MKKQITIFILLFFNCIFAWSQDSFVKTDLPCDKDLILKTPGRWLKVDENAYGVAKVTSQQRQELMNRLNKIHQWIYDFYRSPTGVDARPLHFTMDKYFASQLKVERLQNDRILGTDVDGIPVIFYRYAAMFCGYNCGRTTYEIRRSPGCEAPTTISITINNLDDIFIQLRLDDYFKEIMRVEGRPIKMLSPIVGKWKGYDVYNSNGIYNTNEEIVFLLHREGMLPYIPVTRKQYLDRYFECLQIFFDKMIKSSEHPEGLALLMDKKEREEQTNKIKKQKDDVMKYYQDELEATTKAGLLDAPAIMFGDVMPLLTQYPIFMTKEKGGSMLVTENPAYIRKDLPKYIPQFIIYQLSNGPVYYIDQSLNPYKLIDDNFPIEKLQAMIDK